MERSIHDLFDESIASGMWSRFPSLRALREFEDTPPAVDMYDNKDEIVVRCRGPA